MTFKLIRNCLAILSVIWFMEPVHGQQELQQVIDESVQNLLDLQESDGAWPYEGVYRVRGNIPVGYRIGGTAIVCQALMYSGDAKNENVAGAMKSGTELIMRELEHPLMEMSVEDRYDVRVWGHIFALDYFCRLQSSEYKELAEQTKDWIPKLTRILLDEEIEGGGWNYASQRRHAAFVTAPAIQALLWAKSLGQSIPDDCLDRCAQVLEKSRTEDGAYQYSGTVGGRRNDLLPGSIARSAVCEATLLLLNQGEQEKLQHAVDAFHEHWDELEKRRQKTGTHKPPYGVAPYYFYFGHRYLAQSIGLLSKENQAEEFQRFREVLMRTRDEDGTWNDRVFPRSRAFGTAMSLLALRRNDVPLPPAIQANEK